MARRAAANGKIKKLRYFFFPIYFSQKILLLSAMGQLFKNTSDNLRWYQAVVIK